ncbi:MAG TPA: hypothetical protein VFW71_04830 [Actinomycetota bacterium]|nr:hypothetical protein [Actinomycetota bacterium]
MSDEWAEETEGALGNGLRLAMAIDPRMAEVWSCVFAADGEPGELAEQLGWYLRMAYLRGYHDGLCEPEVGSLFRELGMPVPRRRNPVPAGHRTPNRPGNRSANSPNDRKEAS